MGFVNLDKLDIDDIAEALVLSIYAFVRKKVLFYCLN